MKAQECMSNLKKMIDTYVIQAAAKFELEVAGEITKGDSVNSDEWIYCYLIWNIFCNKMT